MEAPAELFRALALLFEPPGPTHAAVAGALGLAEEPTDLAYTEVFLFQLYPYASVYLGSEGMLGGEARDRAAGFFRALGLVPPPEPDHLSVLLALYANLADQEASTVDSSGKHALGRARGALLWEHLVSWLPPYLDHLIRIAPPPYNAVGEILREALRQESLALAAPFPLPLSLREASPLADPRQDDLDSFLKSLLAPVRSGIIVTRSDLARAAADLGLGLRAGERRYALKALLSQDPAAVLGWLANNAREWEAMHQARDYAEDVARFWAERAHSTAIVLTELSQSAEEVAQAANVV